MPELLFRLRNVPDDEADEIRQLLGEHDIEFYETHAGGWGISMPGIWLPDDSRFDEARGLIDAYQAERARRSRAAYEQMQRDGTAPSLAGRIRSHPVRFLFLLAALLLVLYVTLRPFLSIGR